MNAPWFDPNTYAWIPGTALGTLGGFWGAFVGVAASQGKAKRLVYGSGAVLLIAGLAMLVVGLVALISGQPYGVWYGLLLPGVMTAVSATWLPPLLRLRYRQAEERKMEAVDLNP